RIREKSLNAFTAPTRPEAGILVEPALGLRLRSGLCSSTMAQSLSRAPLAKDQLSKCTFQCGTKPGLHQGDRSKIRIITQRLFDENSWLGGYFRRIGNFLFLAFPGVHESCWKDTSASQHAHLPPGNQFQAVAA